MDNEDELSDLDTQVSKNIDDINTLDTLIYDNMMCIA